MEDNFTITRFFFFFFLQGNDRQDEEASIIKYFLNKIGKVLAVCIEIVLVFRRAAPVWLAGY